MSKRFVPTIVGIALATALGLTGCGSHNSQVQAPTPTCIWSDGTTHTATNGLCPKDPGTAPSAPNHSPAPAPSGSADNTPPATTTDPSHTSTSSPDLSSKASTQPSHHSDAVPPLSSVDAKCPWAVMGDNPPAVQDGGQGLQPLFTLPQKPTASALKCAMARAEAAGLVPMPGNGVDQHYTQVIHPLFNGTDTWTFQPLWVTFGQPQKAALCYGSLVVIDYQGNYVWSDTKDPYSYINVTASKLEKFSLFDVCG